MRALLLALLLSAAPLAASAKEGAGQCLWQTLPQLARDEAVLAYGRDGRAAFLQRMEGVSQRLAPEGLERCLGPEPGDDVLKPAAEAFSAFALETAASETLARRAGRTVGVVQTLWPALTADQRARFRAIVEGVEIELEDVRVLDESARLIGIAPETRIQGDPRFEDVLTLFYASASREIAEAKF